MIVSRFDENELSSVSGIDMKAVAGLGPSAAWARIRPGKRGRVDQHDECETLVIVRGSGELQLDGQTESLTPGKVINIAPFERHVIANTGDEELVYFDLYWRDPMAAARAAETSPTDYFGHRPVFVFSTPPTPNGDLHLGHLSGPYLGADVYVRYLRMNGVEAWHISGSDDHQSYVAERARLEADDPRHIARTFSQAIMETLDLMDVTLDEYIVTSRDQEYQDGLRQFFSCLSSSAAVRLAEYPALFDADTGEYLYEASVYGCCPGCGVRTNGNICEECGEPNICTDMINPVSRRSDKPPQRRGALQYAVDVSEFREVVAEHHQQGRVPARLRELAQRVFTRTNLTIPITHMSNWGVQPAGQAVDNQIIWVWPEMAFGFLYGIERLGERLNKGWRADSPQPDWKIVHFFGYDNSFYHSILYPALYKAAFPAWKPDIDYHLNEFYLLAGEKFSTSRRHAIWGKEVLDAHTVDSIRYYLALTRPEGRRTSFHESEYDDVVHHILIGSWQSWLVDLGRRIIDRYGGVAPDAGVWTREHVGMLRRLEERRSALAGWLGPDSFSLNQAATELNGLVDDIQRFHEAEQATSQSPRWESEARTAVALELAGARLLATCAAPLMPRFAVSLTARLALPQPTKWPVAVEMVPQGATIDLASGGFFRPANLKSAAVSADH